MAVTTRRSVRVLCLSRQGERGVVGLAGEVKSGHSQGHGSRAPVITVREESPVTDPVATRLRSSLRGPLFQGRRRGIPRTGGAQPPFVAIETTRTSRRSLRPK